MISSPVCRGCQHISVSCPREENIIMSNKTAIRSNIVLTVAISLLSPRLSTVTGYILPIDELSTIRFETIHSDIKKILPLCKPGLHCFRIGKIRDIGSCKPMTIWNTIWCSICIHYTKFVDNSIFLVQLILNAVRLIFILLFIDWDLPQNEVESSSMQILDHPTRILPVSAF